MMDALRNQIIERKVIDLVLDKAEFKDIPYKPEGAVEVQELKKGQAVYVPGRYAHRSINISPSEPLITFFAFPGHAGHDYGTIESKGFRKLVVERDGKPALIDNPRWAS